MKVARDFFKKCHGPLEWAKIGKIQKVLQNFVFRVISMKMRSGNAIESFGKVSQT